MNKYSISITCCALLTLAALIVACSQTFGNPSDSNQNTSPASVVTSASIIPDTPQTLYKSNCMTCHGTNLQGKIGPSLEKIGSKLTHEQIVDKIKNGKGGMPVFGKHLSEEDIQSLTTWLAASK